MYTTTNFKTKKALKEAVAAYLARDELRATGSLTIGAVMAARTSVLPVRIFQPGPFGGSVPTDGTVDLEGPHYPAPHTWYATAILKDGVVVKVS